MVKHIVIYKIKDGVDKMSAIEEIRQNLEALVGVVPGLLVMQIRPTMGEEFDYALYSEFDSLESLQGYKTHPAHLAVKPIVHGYISSRTACDFEI